MTTANYSVNFSAVLSSTAGTIALGDVLCQASTGDGYVLSTTANKGTRYSVGIARAPSSSPSTVPIQSNGIADASVTGLGVQAGGLTQFVRVSSAGRLERVAIPGASDEVVGLADEFGNVLCGFVGLSLNLAGTAVGGSLAGTLPNPTVVQVDGVAGILASVAREIRQTVDTKCQPRTITNHYTTVGTSQETAYTAAAVLTGGAKVDAAILATSASGADVASWDISALFRLTSGTLTMQGTVPSSAGVAPDNNSSGASGWLATVDFTGTTPRVRVTSPGGSGVTFGIVYQSIPVVP